MIPDCVVDIPDTPFFCGVVVVTSEDVLPPAFARAEPIICIICPMVILLMAPTFEIESLGLTDTVLSALLTADVLPPFPPFSGVGLWVFPLYQQSLVACDFPHIAHFSLSAFPFFDFPLESFPF